jgi:hypothetical protein
MSENKTADRRVITRQQKQDNRVKHSRAKACVLSVFCQLSHCSVSPGCKKLVVLFSLTVQSGVQQIRNDPRNVVSIPNRTHQRAM